MYSVDAIPTNIRINYIQAPSSVNNYIIGGDKIGVENVENRALIKRVVVLRND